MTNNKNLLICLPVILISMLLMKPFFAASEEIRLTSGEWAPYLSEHLPHFGFASHVVKEACVALIKSGRYQQMLSALERGRYDEK